MASIKHTSVSTNFRRNINSNLTSNKYVHACHIDLTSNSDLYETVIIDDEVDKEPAIQENSDISRNADQSAILVESTEEGEITSEDNEIYEIKNEKRKTIKRKSSVIAVDKGGVPNKNIKISQIENLVISISTNFEQDIRSSSSHFLYKNTTEGKVQTSHKKGLKKKQKKRQHSKFKDFKIEKITKTHCNNCCKCVERKTRSQEAKRHIQRGHRETRKSPQVITKTRSADREASTLKSVGSQDRPVPECRRSCSRATRNYIPKYLVYCDRQAEKIDSSTVEQLECISSDELNVSESHDLDSSFSLPDIETLITRTRKNKISTLEQLECISSDELNVSESHDLDSSFSLSDIETLITRTRKLAQNPLNLQIKEIGHIEQKPVNLSEDTLCANSNKVELKESEKENPNENLQQKPLRLTLVPIEKLRAPVYKVCENDQENLSENKMTKPTKTNKVKINGTVKPIQQSERKKTTKKKSSKKTAQNKCLMLEKLTQKPLKHQEIDVSVGSILKERYETCEIVRRGSYSNIVRVIDRKNSDNILLLKILHQKKYSNMLYNLKLLNGIDLADKYQCVRLNGTFFVNNHLALWLEDYGCNLQQSLERRSCGFPFATVQHLGRQLLMAVQFLREINILHGNIRPEHILMGSNDSNLKLTGFDGAIKRYEKCITSSERGPVNYQAPEIILNLKFGFSVDIWSAACVIYEMAAGKRLFSSSTENQVLWQIMNLQGQFPGGMRAGEHFDKGIFILKYLNVDTGLEEWKPTQRIATKRNLKTELTLAYLDSSTPEEAECKRGAKLVNLLSMALHSMLLLEPSRRIAVDFALLNQFFQITP